MGLAAAPQSFAPLAREGNLRAADGQPGESPLDPLVAALGRAVERSAQTNRRDDARDGQG